jgi:hypothetical protein
MLRKYKLDVSKAVQAAGFMRKFRESKNIEYTDGSCTNGGKT